MMFLISSPGEWAVVILIALLLFGPGRLGDIGEGLGKGIRGFKRAMQEDDDDDQKQIPTSEKPKEIPPGDLKEDK
jgi:sec-independent protein translocase protein TatA